MGQTASVDTIKQNVSVDNLQIQVMKHSKVFSEIGSLSYEDFKKCLDELNNLSHKCLDSDGKQLVFLIKKGSDSTVLWKATVKIACVKVDPITRKIDQYNFLNLKQFLCVFKTFQANLESLMSSEENQLENHSAITTALLDNINGISTDLNSSTEDDKSSECCICLERKPEVLLPCTHVFCSPCIEQWNTNNKTCPICCQELNSTDDTWVLSEIPGVDEISDNICSELMSLSNQRD